MPPSTRTRVLVLLIGLAILAGSTLLFWAGAADHLDSHDRDTRDMACSFALMMSCLGMSGVSRAIWPQTHSSRVISALFFCTGFMMFAMGFILIGLFRSHTIGGGLPFLPTWLNQKIGAVIFILVGVTILLFLPLIYRQHRDQE